MLPLVRMFFYCLLMVILLVVLHIRQAYACSQLASAPHSQWKIEAHDGASWLLTPCGERFLSIGVNVLDGGYPSRSFDDRLAYHWGTFYPDLETWAAATRQRLLTWGFNTAGAWSLGPSRLALPVIPSLELGRTLRFLWADPFRPTMEEEMRTLARQLVAPYKGNPYRIGYFPDNEIGWWYPAFFIYYVQQPAASYTKQRLLALLRGQYDNDWTRFTRDFVPPADVSSFEELLHSEGSPQLRIGGEGIQVIGRWMRIVAEHYYRLVQRTIREADPEALIFTDRLQIYYDPNVVHAMVPYIDAVATNYDVDGQDGSIARYYFDGLRQLTNNKPVLVSEWFFAAHENRSGNLNRYITDNQRILEGLLMTVQTQAERTRGAMAAAQGFAKLPQLIGLHWFQYYDHPFGGRPSPDREDFNFGLVDIHDRPYEALTEAFSHLNPQLTEIHQKAGQGISAIAPNTPLEIPEAAIDLSDRSLREWPKERAFVPGLIAPFPEAVFGDVYLAWDHAALYLATISMDYSSPELLAFDGTFPLEEAFRLEWGVNAGGRVQRFALYIVPPKEYPKEGPPLTRAHLCRITHGTCEPVPGAVASYFGKDSPRILAEVALPWRSLGLDGPPTTGQLHMELAATSYHRARWMSWSGLPPVVGLQDTAAWHTVRLGGR
ncbi:MAG TPA: hypothetical protein VI542_28420 [Candidatus Tectomicrobia bacterium]